MENIKKKLVLIKTLHTIIWTLFVIVIIYILYSGLFNHKTIFTWFSVGAVILEGIILLLYKMFCPLTLIARKYSDSDKHSLDIYLPEWLAKHNKLIFTTIYFIAVLILLYRIYF